MSSAPLFTCAGGRVVLPLQPLLDRRDGGHLIVTPPRDVWERSVLNREELAGWSELVAATGGAMLETLPQLEGGCVNYWEAGNWSLHDDTEPRGPKNAREHRHVHLHIFGRSRTAVHPAWQWGEAPRFPSFADRMSWAAPFRPLDDDECARIAAGIAARWGRA
jgi:hypothetical protein